MPLAPRLWAFPARAERSILCPPSRTRDEDERSLIRFVLYLSSFVMKSFPTLRSCLSLFSSVLSLSLNGICFQFIKKEIARCELLPSNQLALSSLLPTYASIPFTSRSTSPLASGAVYVTERYGTRPGARYKGYEPYNGL
ncbi:hypothetical protein V6N11_030950 [Hibiscus sabdariffa]|uniref:Uncharacterized protein n=1 Tax=Hibiscus sabdariffa TaxID=183260 RepID=A0ABR2NRX2_9ROSI